MWWTRERRRAIDVAGRVEPRERLTGVRDERRFSVRQNRVVLTPVAGAKSAVATQTRPGLRSHLNPPTTVTRRIRRRGERGISRKAITQGMPDASAEPVCSCAHFLVQLAHETAGAARTRHSLRPLLFGARDSWNHSGAWRRGSVNSCPPSLRAKRSNPLFLCMARWIASRSLSSGAHSRDPLARNDDPFTLRIVTAQQRHDFIRGRTGTCDT